MLNLDVDQLRHLANVCRSLASEIDFAVGVVVKVEQDLEVLERAVAGVRGPAAAEGAGGEEEARVIAKAKAWAELVTQDLKGRGHARFSDPEHEPGAAVCNDLLDAVGDLGRKEATS